MATSPPGGRGEQAAAVAGPVRMCAGCRERAPKSTLLRIVAGPDGLLLDERQRRGGRGAYLHPGADCWRAAGRRRSVERGLRVPAGRRTVLDLRPELAP